MDIVDEDKLGASIARNIGQELRGILTAYRIDQLVDKGIKISSPNGCSGEISGKPFKFKGELIVGIAD